VLLEIKGDFTQTFEKYILPMDSMYGKRIYELLIENKNIGYRKFKIDDLYTILQVPKSMQTYANFKEKVLLIAIKEINKHTDIFIPVDTTNLRDASWIKLQCGVSRKITHLNFEFQMKNKTQKSSNEIQQPLLQKVPDSQLTKVQIVKEKITKVINKSSIEIMATDHETGQINSHLKQYFNERLYDFIDFCAENNKEYKNWHLSFDRHIKGYEKNIGKKFDKRV